MPDNEETNNDSENSHLSKSFNETDTEPPENDTHEQTGEITIPDRCPCTFKSKTKGCFHIFSTIEVILDTFEEKDISINSNTDT